MSSFGDTFRLTLITADRQLAAAADACGVDRIGVDIERLNKAGRQPGFGHRISPHTWQDLRDIAAAVERADLFVRLNPVHPGTASEIETALDIGAEVLMLPFFRAADEAGRFADLVDGRARVVLLLETAPALVRIDQILALRGVDEIMLGLNDLRLQLGVSNHFEVLASPLLDGVAELVRAAGLPLSVGGVGRVDDTDQPIPVDLVYAQYPRLGATGAWVARSFFNGTPPDWDFAPAIAALRRRLTHWSRASSAELKSAREDLAHRSMVLGGL